MRPLLQILGEAINEALSESDRINEAIEKIREAGYDVFLVLEATMGFNRREDAPAEEPAPMREPEPLVRGDGQVKPGVFGGAADTRFLRALKISLE